jgi:hypothetical protein
VLPTTDTVLSNILFSRLTLYAHEIIVDHHVDYDVTDQTLIKYSTFVRYGVKTGV